MKAVERNISRHENGILYLRVKKDGKLITRSLKTMDLKEARRKIEAEGLDSFINSKAARRPEVPLLELGLKKDFLVTGITLAVALMEHEAGLVHNSKSRREMSKRCAKRVLEYGNLTDFDPLGVWKAYRTSGFGTQGKELGSACNHMRWFLGSFVRWGIAKKYLSAECRDSLAMIPRIRVNPRRIRIPSVETVRDFLAMVRTEDPKGAAFLEFLGSSGLRLSGARDLRWQDIDFDLGTMVVVQKGKTEKVIPMTPEAQAMLLERRGEAKPWEFSDRAIKSLRSRAKRFAVGFGIDLTTFHPFRHYFASRCLMAGLTVQEVADLLGHSDNGQLVLRTYGHLCKEHLRAAVAGLRLVS